MRRTAAILILLVLPLMARGPELSAQQGATHTVRSGETLSSIAQIYFGSAAEWQRLYDANRDRILNPDRISPGLVIVIPGRAAAVPTAQVMGMVLDGAPLTAHTARRELAQQRRFTPASTPGHTRERTLFYDARGPDDMPPPVYFVPADEVTALPRSVFRSAGWIDDGEPPLGTVIAFAGDVAFAFGKTTVHPFDEVRVQFSVPGTPETGDRFLVYRESRTLDQVGKLLVPTGVLEVRRTDAAGSVAQVVAEFDRIQLGQFVTRFPAFPLEPGAHPVPVEVDFQMSLLAFQDRKELHLPGDLAFVDRGSAAGLAVGDEFTAYAGDSGGWEGRRVARFQVVGTREQTSTVRIVNVTSPHALVPGLRLHLDRKMP